MAENQPKNKHQRSSDNAAGRAKLLSSSLVVGLGTLISRISGFARDVVIAVNFGASPLTDAFFVAFKIPNFFRRLFAEGSFTQGFVPVLSEYKTHQSHAFIRSFLSYVAGTLALFLLLFAGLGILFSDWVVLALAPGFHAQPAQQALTADMLSITFPYLWFISLTAMAAGILNVYRHFWLSAVAPVWLNLSLIVGGVFVAPMLGVPIMALAWAVLIAGLIQLIFVLFGLARLDLLVWPRFRPQDVGVRRVIRLMLPAMFGAAVSQINIMIDLILASLLVSGSISWLYYSDRLMELPLGLFGVTLATVVLPSLSSDHARGSTLAFRRTLDWALRLGFLFGAPATLALMILSEALLTTLFQYGSTTVFDVQMAARSLMAYSLGLLGLMLAKILAATFVSRQDTRTPVYAGLVAVVTNIVLSLALIGPLAHAGLALATAIAAIVNATMLFVILVYRKRLTLPTIWRFFLLRLAAALGSMALVLFYARQAIGDLFVYSLGERVLYLLLLCLVGGLTYLGVLMLFGFRFSHLRRQVYLSSSRRA